MAADAEKFFVANYSTSLPHLAAVSLYDDIAMVLLASKDVEGWATEIKEQSGHCIWPAIAKKITAKNAPVACGKSDISRIMNRLLQL